MAKLTFLFLALLFAPELWATTYYVDFAAGADTNNGLTTGTAFKYCPGDDAATGLADFILSAGDTVIFKGGVTYTGEIDIDASGTAGNPITYDGNSAGTWGTGRALIDLNAATYQAFNGAVARSYITIKYFKIFNAKNANGDQNQTITRGGMDITGVNYGGNGNGPLGLIYNIGGSSSNWNISYCQFYETENWSDRAVLGAETDADPQTASTVPANQAGINFGAGVSNSTIDHCEFWAIGRDAIRLLGSSGGSVSNVSVTNCNFGGGADAGANVGWFSVAIRIGGARDITVSDNVFHDGWQYQGNEDVAGVPTQRSHAGDWLHIMGNNSVVFEEAADAVNITVERNYFYNSTAFIGSGGTATVFVEDGVSNLTFRNNLFINDFSGALEIEVVIGCYIYNNTFVSLNPTMSGVHTPFYLFTGSGPLLGVRPTGVVIKNNLFIALNTNSVGMCWGTSASGITYPTSNYNRFYAPNLGSTNIIRWHSVNRTLAQWQADSGQDLNSTVGDPLLVGTLTDLPISTSAPNYKPASVTSPVVGAGVTIAGFTGDYLGVARAVPWDIGALQFAAGPTPGTDGLTAPRNLSRVTARQRTRRVIR